MISGELLFEIQQEVTPFSISTGLGTDPLREGYIETHSSTRSLRRLLTDSYSTFVALFRGCLHLHGDQVPLHNEEVVAAFCARAELDPAAFREVDRLKHSEHVATDLKSLFSRYYDELTKAVTRVDRFETHRGGQTT